MLGPFVPTRRTGVHEPHRAHRASVRLLRVGAFVRGNVALLDEPPGAQTWVGAGPGARLCFGGERSVLLLFFEELPPPL